MEYRSIFELTNQYPSVTNYDTQLNSNMILFGIYPNNFLEFKIPSLEDIEIVENTTFRFILEVKESTISDEVRYFTSRNFYDDLILSKTENNPYHIQVALDAGLFVRISLDKQIELFNQLKLIDLGTGVRQNQNLFLLADNSVDYVTLVQYIDWLVARVDPLDNENNGVIPSEKIADFEIGKYDKNTGEFIPITEQAVLLQNRIDALEEELAEIDEAILAIQGDIIQEPKRRKTTALEVISLGLSALAISKGVSTAVKSLGKATAVTKVLEPVKITSNLKPLPPIVKPNVKPPDFSTLFGSRSVPSQALVSNGIKSIGASGKKLLAAARNTAKTGAAAVAAASAATAQFLVRQTNSRLGQAVLNSGIKATIKKGTTDIPSNNENARKKQTEIVLKSVAKSAALEVGKTVAKRAATKLGTAAVGKILGAATGPIGAGIMAAAGIVKFFVKRGKEKKEFEKQKKQYDKVMGELERLTRRKEDIEAEIAGIINSGKLNLARQFDDRFSSTQKYFANIGKSILEMQQATNPIISGG